MERVSSIHASFESQVERTPENIAVALGGEQLTYRELNARANQFAHFLRKRGVGPDVFVGICVDRTLALVVGILGILKAGGAYVPIDPHYPTERVAFMLEDCQSHLLVTEEALCRDLGLDHHTRVYLDRDWPEVATESTTNLEVQSAPDDLAYVIYTSGSTGTPKGTLISHRNVLRLFSSTQPWFMFTQHDVWTLFHSCAFDFSVWEIWGALLYGGKLVIVPFEVSRTPAAFYRLLREHAVTVLNQTPSAFRQLMRAEEPADESPSPLALRPGPLALRYVIFGGEALDLKMLKPWFERHGDRRPVLVNMYGITETTVHVTYRPLRAADLNSPSLIGVPIPDLQIHLLDQAQAPVAAGEPGEIYVGGAGVARGYLKRPELTAERFVPDPFSSTPGQRLYRSGDLGRLLPDGDLEYLGRIDAQVKIRGFRIELGEIAAALNRHPGVRDSVVIVVDDAAGEKALAAYLVAQPVREPAAVTNPAGALDPAALRASLRTQLPEYMIPTYIQPIEALPLTVNGKLDVKALPPPQRSIPGAAGHAADVRQGQSTRLESQLAAIWRDVLHIDAVGLDQNFFDVGGNSIHIAEVHAQLQRLLSFKFPITELFAHATVRSLAAHFETAVGAPPGAGGANRMRAQRQREALSVRRLQHMDRK